MVYTSHSHSGLLNTSLSKPACLIKTSIVLPRDLNAVRSRRYHGGIMPGTTTVLGLFRPQSQSTMSTEYFLCLQICVDLWAPVFSRSTSQWNLQMLSASTTVPLGMKLSSLRCGATDPGGSHNIKVPQGLNESNFLGISHGNLFKKTINHHWLSSPFKQQPHNFSYNYPKLTQNVMNLIQNCWESN